MPTGPLIYEILLFSTLSFGLLALLADIMARRRNPRPATRTRASATTETAPETSPRKTDEQWRRELTPEQYDVIRRGVTERPFTGLYWDHTREGVYHCVGCGAELFGSSAKFDSGTGWPSFSEPVSETAVVELKSISFGLVRTEVICRRCEAHLGHLFADGRAPAGRRYCVNSIALDFRPVEIEIEAASGQ